MYNSVSSQNNHCNKEVFLSPMNQNRARGMTSQQPPIPLKLISSYLETDDCKHVKQC